MIAAVADTHTVIWYLSQSSRLSNNAKSFIDNATANGDQIGLSSISLIEMIYLIEKGRIPAESLSDLIESLSDTDSPLVEVHVSLQVAQSLALVDSSQVRDMPDRIIAATTLHLTVPLISRDAKIRASAIQTIW